LRKVTNETDTAQLQDPLQLVYRVFPFSIG
jgi:hypothetical protein